jgi:Holliday junction resolvase
MTETAETVALERQVPTLTAEGFDVILQPRRADVPKFLGSYSPDALAFRKDKNLVVEVMRESPESSIKLKRIRSLLDGREGWELKIIWISPFGDRNVIGVQSKSAIQRRLN